MSDDCCQDAARELVKTAERRRILRIVLAINVVVFVAEFGAGWIARSVAVQADSLDALFLKTSWSVLKAARDQLVHVRL